MLRQGKNADRDMSILHLQVQVRRCESIDLRCLPQAAPLRVWVRISREDARTPLGSEPQPGNAHACGARQASASDHWCSEPGQAPLGAQGHLGEGARLTPEPPIPKALGSVSAQHEAAEGVFVGAPTCSVLPALQTAGAHRTVRCRLRRRAAEAGYRGQRVLAPLLPILRDQARLTDAAQHAPRRQAQGYLST